MRPVTPPPATIVVVAAVVVRAGRYLVARRPPHKQHGGLWEFPGGKVRAAETLHAALARELEEELGVTSVSFGPTLYTDRDAPTDPLIHFIAVDVEGAPAALEHTALAWHSPVELIALPLAPADARFAHTCLAQAHS